MKKWVKITSLVIVTLVVSILTAAFIYEQISRIAAIRNYPPEGELVDVGGRNLHVIRKGAGGPTVVFESGLDSYGHLSWFKVEAEISRSATTMSYDRAGVLWSERGSEGKTAEAMSKDLSVLLTKGNFAKPYILVGHSFAGITLRPFIIENAEDIAGLVLVDTSHSDQLERIPSQLTDSPSIGLTNLFSLFGLIRLWQSDDFLNTKPEDRINTAGPALAPGNLSGMLDELENMGTLLEEAKQISSFGDIPVVVITGASPSRYEELPEEFRDDMKNIWNELQSDLLNLSTNSRQVFALDSGHYVQLDQPDIVVRAIADLISNIEGN